MSDDWKPGAVFMESVEIGSTTLTQHRCWNTERFMRTRKDEAAEKTRKAAAGDGDPVAVRFLSEAEYKRKGGR